MEWYKLKNNVRRDILEGLTIDWYGVRPPIDFAGQSVENSYLSIDLQNYQFIDGKLSPKIF